MLFRSEEPVVEETEEPVVEETVEPTETPVPARSVMIICEQNEIEIGDTVTLKSVLSGFDGVSVSYCWQWYTQDEEGEWDWRDAPGGSGDSYTYTMTEEMMYREFRLLVTTNE